MIINELEYPTRISKTIEKYISYSSKKDAESEKDEVSVYPRYEYLIGYLHIEKIVDHIDSCDKSEK